tara:strand:+ start:411 stop:545 length:135 start_codon:yes stop_codon:yes gene_type:complete
MEEPKKDKEIFSQFYTEKILNQYTKLTAVYFPTALLFVDFIQLN